RAGECLDIEGKTVDPLQDVKEFLSANLPRHLRLKSVRLSLGWLKGGSETSVAAPQPLRMARLQEDDVQSGQYPAFTNVPVGKKNFSFAGLGSNAHLVSTRNFQEADGEHINSIIKIECTLLSNDAGQSKIECVTCCQPYSQPDLATKGSMTVRFSGRPMPGVLSWNEFLSKGCFQDNKITNYDVLGGDYPFDEKAKMYLSQRPQSSTSEEFAEHFYYWLRSTHAAPRLDAIFAMINEPFLSGTNQVYSYEVANDGAINRKVMDLTHFTRSVTADGQSIAMADTRIRSGASAIIFFRDNVVRQNKASGKHAGQPLAGYPLSNLDGWIDQNQLSSNFGKRSNSPNGLALDIEIGGTGDSTARRDVLSMHQRTMSRKI
ncbi:MAG: hypothetical protein K2X81_27880, partial [Candidatus Obscuribacterales bacterium]|nr:hypothetical protein [Candidatus Obscuribacterales bacterium]